MMYPWFRLRRRMMMSAGGLDIASLAITYTGTYTDYGVVTMTDGDYRLLAMTGSGTLTIAKPVNCEVCVVGGGSNGGNTKCQGGAGAYLTNASLAEFTGSAIVIGAAQGASSISTASVSAVKGSNGGTGGGGYRGYSGGTGDGLSKYPFGDDTYSLWAGKPHCGGGGGGMMLEYNGGSTDYYPGDGGTNGGRGGSSTITNPGRGSWDEKGGTGGSYGGGDGGGYWGSYKNGTNATYYGSGGGGQGVRNTTYGTVGSGYQGIVYLRIPTKQ